MTARRVAGEVGASTQAVYTHFGGMDELLAEIWREGFRRFGDALDEPAVTDDPVADWMAQGWGYRRFALRDPHLYRVMFGEGLVAFRLNDERDREAASGTFLSLLTRIERCVAAGRWAGRRPLHGGRGGVVDRPRALHHRADRLLRAPRPRPAAHLRGGAAHGRRSGSATTRPWSRPRCRRLAAGRPGPTPPPDLSGGRPPGVGARARPPPAPRPRGPPRRRGPAPPADDASVRRRARSSGRGGAGSAQVRPGRVHGGRGRIERAAARRPARSPRPRRASCVAAGIVVGGLHEPPLEGGPVAREVHDAVPPSGHVGPPHVREATDEPVEDPPRPRGAAPSHRLRGHRGDRHLHGHRRRSVRRCGPSKAHEEWTSPERISDRPRRAPVPPSARTSRVPLVRVAVPLVVVQHLAVEDGVAVGQQVVDAGHGRHRQADLVDDDTADEHGPRSARRRRGARRASARWSSPSSERSGSCSALVPSSPACWSRPLRRVSSRRSSARSPTGTARHVDRGSAGSRGRCGSHSSRAPRAAADAVAPAARPPSTSCFLAPSVQQLSATSWSSTTATIGWRRWRAWASGSLADLAQAGPVVVEGAARVRRARAAADPHRPSSS